jgi:2-phospho-L-lactate guanylyltransferase
VTLLAAIPVKPFGVAKARLSGELGPEQRTRLGKAIAARTAVLARQAGARVVVVTGDTGVAAWAQSIGFDVLPEGPQTGLDAAAASAAAAATERWAIIHADLPLATAADFRTVFDATGDGIVLVPSYDGGTNVVAGSNPEFPFSYGPGSFHRHLAAAPGAQVLTHPRLAMDLDTPRDLDYARASRRGGWLEPFLSNG